MNTKLYKKTISIILLVFALFASSFAFFFTTTNANGAETENNYVEFHIEGAEVRVVSPSGIGFVTYVDKDDCVEYDGSNGGYKFIEDRVFGTLLIPTEYIAIQNDKGVTGDLKLENWQAYNAINIVANNWQTSLNEVSETSQYLSYSAVMVGSYDELTNTYSGLDEKYYNVEMTAISYYYDNGDISTAKYTPIVKRSLAGVASTALAGGYATETAQLIEIVDKVIGENGISFSEGESISLKELTNPTLTLVGNKGLTAKWTTSDPNVAKVDSNGAITVVNYGECVITALIGTKVASCTITIESIPYIEVPTDIETGVAGISYAIPQASVYSAGELLSQKPTVTAQFKGTYDSETIDVVDVDNFVAPSSGVISVTYSYENAEEQTIEIPVSRGAVSQTHALDFSSSDVVADMHVGNNNVLEYVADDTTPYVKWSITNDAQASWQQLKVSSTLSDEVLNNYDYIRVKMKAVSTGTNRWRVFMCNNKYITGPNADTDGESAYSSLERLALNEWNDVFLPVSAFVQSGNGYNTWFISQNFNCPGDGHADNIKEVYITDFELINFTFAVEKDTYAETENPTFIANGDLGKDYVVVISQDEAIIATLTANGSTYTWNNSNVLTGAFKANVIVDNRVVATTSFGISIEPVTIFSPTSEQYCKSVFTIKNKGTFKFVANGANGDYAGNYTGATGSGWSDIYFDYKKDNSNIDFSKYNYIEIWIYIHHSTSSDKSTTYSVSFYNNTAYKYFYTVNTWHKVRLDAKAFVEQMGAKNNFLCTINISGSIKGLYIGTITATI